MTGFIARNDWKIFTALSLLYGVYAAVDILLGGQTYAGLEEVLFYGVTGMMWDQLQASSPAVARFIDGQVRSSGALLLVITLLSLAISLFGLRRRQRWAWWTMWIWPIWLLSVVVMGLITERMPGAGYPLPVIAAAVSLIVTVPTLALTFRTYNPAP